MNRLKRGPNTASRSANLSGAMTHQPDHSELTAKQGACQDEEDRATSELHHPGLIEGVEVIGAGAALCISRASGHGVDL